VAIAGQIDPAALNQASPVGGIFNPRIMWPEKIHADLFLSEYWKSETAEACLFSDDPFSGVPPKEVFDQNS